MGVHRNGGYSATVKGFLLVGQASYQIAKTDGETVVLAEACQIPAKTDAFLSIIVDGDETRESVFLPYGVELGEKAVKYVANDVQDIPF